MSNVCRSWHCDTHTREFSNDQTIFMKSLYTLIIWEMHSILKGFHVVSIVVEPVPCHDPFSRYTVITCFNASNVLCYMI